MPVWCAAHVTGIGAPGLYKSQQALEVANKELKRQRAERTMRYGPEVGEGASTYLTLVLWIAPLQI